MDVRIGIIQSPREITFETVATAEELLAQVETAETEGQRFVAFTDVKNNQFLINIDAIGYIECGADTARRVGFVS